MQSLDVTFTRLEGIEIQVLPKWNSGSCNAKFLGFHASYVNHPVHTGVERMLYALGGMDLGTGH
jgi:hypothetical protein